MAICVISFVVDHACGHQPCEKCASSSVSRSCAMEVFLVLLCLVPMSQTTLFGGFGRQARVRLIPANQSGVTGIIHFEQTTPSSPVLIRGFVRGLKRGPHGFHIHTKGRLSNNCADAGPHFNPFKKSHGDPNVQTFFGLRKEGNDRHVGDLGNIFTPLNGDYPTQIFKVDGLITLQDGKANSIIGRSIVVHADEDDLGKGNNAESKKTGNAGARLACGIIEKF